MPGKKRVSPSTPAASRPHMPGYGIPEARKGLLPWSWAQQRLKKSHNYWITTVRPDGSPHTMVVWGLWMDGRLYFSTGLQSRKARNLARNPHCIVCTENAAEAVIVEGTAQSLKTLAKRQVFFSLYEKKYRWDMSAFQDEPIFEVRPRIAFGLFEKKFMGSATRWKFRSR
jgi:nitroimidazol reductase NimA-like FMN-containing flavoprotein (pyridoxamine 5'-phosphate oxidase superfamily)